MSTKAHKSDDRRTEPQQGTKHKESPDASQAIAVEHACAEPSKCRHVFASRCSLNGQIDCLEESGWLTQKERRTYQRELRTASTENEAARVVQKAQITGHLRRIEREAIAQRKEEIRTDRAGYLARHRGVAKALRAHNLQKRREREVARAQEQARSEDAPSLSVASWVRVAAAVLADLAPLCRAEGLPLLRVALEDPARARASTGEYRAARHEAESGAEDWALSCAESVAWAQLWGARSASWVAVLSAAASAHAGAAYQAVMSTHASAKSDQVNRQLRADKARQAARAAAEARYAGLVEEARRAEAEAHVAEAKEFSASMRTAGALTRARAAHLLRVAQEPDGFAPHTVCSGAKLGAWTRALRELQRWELVKDVGWRWVLTAEGSAVAARLRERSEARAWLQKHDEAGALAHRTEPAAGASARRACTSRRPQRAQTLRRRPVRPLGLRSVGRPRAGLARGRVLVLPLRCRREEAPLVGRRAPRALSRARGRDGPRAAGRERSEERTQSMRRGGRRSVTGSGS